jgi:hypothetical protein
MPQEREDQAWMDRPLGAVLVWQVPTVKRIVEAQIYNASLSLKESLQEVSSEFCMIHDVGNQMF